MKKLLLKLALALAGCSVGTLAHASGVSVCEIGTSTPTAATVQCATGSSTFYGVEFSSAAGQLSGNNVAIFADVYNAAATTGIILGTESINTTKIATGVLDTYKSSFYLESRPRTASLGIAVTHSNVTVPLKIIYTTP